MLIPIEIDRTQSQPLADQLADRLRDAIRQGRIPEGARLPSSRALAEQLEIARNTVVRAYETLEIEGFVQSRAASGFFATPRASAPALPRSHPGPPDLSKPNDMPQPAAFWAPRRSASSAAPALYDFAPGRPSRDSFPVKAWRRLVQSCLAYGAETGLAEYGDPSGLPALRIALAEHLCIRRGIVADPAQILIVAGVQEGLNLACRLFVVTGSAVVIENPCYQAAAASFEAAGARLLAIDVDDEGLITSSLPEQPTTLAYVTPEHQYPTGCTLSSERRRELIAWARRNGCYLIEDDYDSEFQYEGSPRQAIAGVAPDCTLHLGTFSTTLGAGLRLGYVVVPPALIDPMRAAKASSTNGSPWLEQAVLAQFVRSGSYAAHLTRCRAQYLERRDALLAALRRHFGAVEISGEAVGLQVLWRLPAGVPEAVKLEALAREHQTRVYALGSAGARDLKGTSTARRGLLLGYAGLVPKQIEQGIARLSDIVDDTLDDDHEFIRELLLDSPLPRGTRRAARLRKGAAPLPLPLQRPAIRTITQRHASNETKASGSMRLVRGIYRYPIKGLSPQPVRGIELEAGKPFPFDRVFALARPAVPIDVEAPRWAKKGLFLMLMLDEALARVRTHLDVETMRFTVQRAAHSDASHDECLLSVDLHTREGRELVETFFRHQVPRLDAAPRLVHSSDGHFMDKPDNVLSCINLATIRSLEAEWGQAIHPLRFRANFYIEGARPWEEFDWIGSDIMLGDVLLRVDRRNGRCGATNVNPITGERDMDIPGSLRKRFGHKDLGIYLVARTSGKVVVGDEVSVPDLEPSGADAHACAKPDPARGSFICRGCYYIYDEAAALGGHTADASFNTLPEDWRCPDCGTGKANFRPYMSGLAAAESG